MQDPKTADQSAPTRREQKAAEKAEREKRAARIKAANERKERDAKIVEMRLAGFAFQKIADTVGISKTRVMDVYEKYRTAVPKPSAEHLRFVAIERLERINARLFLNFEKGDLTQAGELRRINLDLLKITGAMDPQQSAGEETTSMRQWAADVLASTAQFAQDMAAGAQAALEAPGDDSAPPA